MNSGREKLQDCLSYPPRLMPVELAARYVGFGVTKFKELIEERKMPQAIDVDGSPRWDRCDLDAAVDDLKDARSDPVKRSRNRLEQRLREQEQGHED
jgi:hypothetical protein